MRNSGRKTIGYITRPWERVNVSRAKGRQNNYWPTEVVEFRKHIHAACIALTFLNLFWINWPCSILNFSKTVCRVHNINCNFDTITIAMIIICDNFLTPKNTVENLDDFVGNRGFKKVENWWFIRKTEANFTKRQYDSNPFFFFSKIDFKYTMLSHCVCSSKIHRTVYFIIESHRVCQC